MVNPGVQENTEYPRHIPVLLNDFVSQLKPLSGVWIDGTFGDGGYSKMLLESDAKSVIAIDRDPSVCSAASVLAKQFPSRFFFCFFYFLFIAYNIVFKKYIFFLFSD